MSILAALKIPEGVHYVCIIGRCMVFSMSPVEYSYPKPIVVRSGINPGGGGGGGGGGGIRRHRGSFHPANQ